MAITLPTTLREGTSIVAGTSLALPTFTMPTTGMVLAYFGIHTVGTLSNPTLTDDLGGTWNTYSDGTNNATQVLATNVSRHKVFRCTSMVGGTITLTISTGANSHDGWTYHVLHYPDCLNQNAIQIVNATATGTAILSTLAAMQASSGTLGFAGNASASGISTVGAGFTASGAGQKPSAISVTTLAEAQTGNDTTVDATGASSVVWGMIAAEVAPNSAYVGSGLGVNRLQRTRFRRPGALWGGSHG